MRRAILVIFLSCNLYIAFSQKIEDTTKLKSIKLQINKFALIDTFFVDTNQKFLENQYKGHVNLYPLINLGHSASPGLNPLFYKQNWFINNFFINFFENLRIENYHFYSTNKPFTDLQYVDGQKLVEEQFFNFLHTQSFKKDTINFGIHTKLYSSLNPLTTKDNFNFTDVKFWFFKKFKNSFLTINFESITYKRNEFGGYIDTSANFNIFDINRRFFIETGGVKNKVNNNLLIFIFVHKINNKNNLKIEIQNSSFKKIFTENLPNRYFGTPIINPYKTFDSIQLVEIVTKTHLISHFNKLTTSLSLVSGIEKYYFFRGFFFSDKGNFLPKLALDASLLLNYKNFKAGFELEYQFLNIYKNNISQNFWIRFVHKNSVLHIIENYSIITPPYFYRFYSGNYQQWINNFKNYEKIYTHIYLSNNKLNSQISLNFIYNKNFIYFDLELIPKQETSTFFVITPSIKQTFNLRPLIIDFELYYQKTNTKKINLPELIAGSCWRFDFSLFRRALTLNLGVHLYYLSQFYEYGYSPSLFIFYQKYEQKTTNYPVLDIFLTAKIKNAIIILSLDNILSQTLFPNISFTDHYPLPVLNFRYGVRWWFKN